MYRAAVEGILGIQRRENGFAVDPSLPSNWPGFTATLNVEGHSACIEVTRDAAGELSVQVNGKSHAAGELVTIEA